jgi:anti-anti-sigma factor
MKVTTQSSDPPADGTAESAGMAQVHRTVAGIRVEVAGDIDVVSVEILRDSLERAAAERPARLEVDLSGVTFLGGAGIGALAAARRAVGDLVVIGANDQVRRILTRFGVVSRVGC